MRTVKDLKTSIGPSHRFYSKFCRRCQYQTHRTRYPLSQPQPQLPGSSPTTTVSSTTSMISTNSPKSHRTVLSLSMRITQKGSYTSTPKITFHLLETSLFQGLRMQTHSLHYSNSFQIRSRHKRNDCKSLKPTNNYVRKELSNLIQVIPYL